MRATRQAIISSGLAALMAISLGVGCGDGDDAKQDDNKDINVPGDVAKSSLARELKPAVVASDAKKLAEGNRDFAFNLYRIVSQENQENLFFSPHSISIALAMAYGGAKGETASEMEDALEFSLRGDKLHSAFNALDLALATRKDSPTGEEGGKPFELSVVNATWGQKGYSFQDSYLDLLAVNYGAGMHLLDFNTDADGSRKKINQWVEDQTKERIKELLPGGSIAESTRLVLTNAIYFKAGWQKEFEKDLTQTAPFTLSGGGTVQADMMKLHSTMQYGEVDGHQVIELPYVGDDVSMVVILPKAGEFSKFDQDLDGGKVGEYIDALASREGTLKLPKFGVESSFSVKDALQALGMKQAFSGAADFSGIDGTKQLSISDVVHKSFVSVDEEGTEAAAATAVIVSGTSAPDDEIEPFEMTVNRPFVFVIHDKPTGAILFVGRVVDPK